MLPSPRRRLPAGIVHCDAIVDRAAEASVEDQEDMPARNLVQVLAEFIEAEAAMIALYGIRGREQRVLAGEDVPPMDVSIEIAVAREENEQLAVLSKFASGLCQTNRIFRKFRLLDFSGFSS